MFRQSAKIGLRRHKRHGIWSFVTNYTTLIRFSAFVGFLCGFLPYKIRSSNFALSKYSLVIGTFETIAYVISAVAAIVQARVLWNHENLSAILHLNFILTLGPLIFISAYFASRLIIRVMQRVSRVSRILSPDAFSRLAKTIYVKDTIMYGIFVGCLFYIVTVGQWWFSLICWMTFLGVLAICTLYVNNVYVLRACFQEINDHLAKLKENLINDQPHLLRRVYHTQRNPELLSVLRDLRQQHLEMIKLVYALNESFSLPNLGIITLLFSDLTYNLYSYLILTNQGGRIRRWFSIQLVFLVYYAVLLVILVWATETARSQIQKTGANVHRILIHTFDEQVTTELELFSLQALQCTDTFSAKGLVLDMTLLTKILSSITTYLLILIQFTQTKSC